MTVLTFSAASIRGVARRRGARPALVAALLALPLLAGVAPEAGAQTLSIDDASMKEGEGTRAQFEGADVTLMKFTVRLSAPQPHSVRVVAKTRNSSPVSARGGRRITAQRDYLRARLLADFYPGQTVAHLWVMVVDDSHEEDDETFELVLQEPQGAKIKRAVAVGTITKNDEPLPVIATNDESLPEIAVSAGGAVVEGGAAEFTITASPAPVERLYLTVTLLADGDFGVIGDGSRTFNVPVENGSGKLKLRTEDDDNDESDGSLTVTVKDDDGYRVGASASVTVSVRDNDDPLPVITVAAGDAVTEGEAATFTLTASPAPASTVTVTVTAAGDFGVSDGSRTVTIPTLGSAALTLATTGDDVDELDGSVTVTVDDGSGYAVGDPPTDAATVRVADNDRRSLSVEDAKIKEGSLSYGNVLMEFKVRLSTPSADTVTVRAATRDSTPATATAHEDYWPVNMRVRFPAGQMERIVGVVIHPDSRYDEDDETFELVLSKARGAVVADRVAKGTIINRAERVARRPAKGPLPTITIAPGGNVTEGEDATFTLTASPVSGSALPLLAELQVKVKVEAEGDFGVLSGFGPRIVTIPTTGEAVFTRGTSNDGVAESDGSVTVTVEDGNGYAVGETKTATVLVADDDTVHVVDSSNRYLWVEDAEIKEGSLSHGNVLMKFKVRLSNPSADTVTVQAATQDLTATAHEDYSPVNRQVSFPAGQTERTVGVVIHPDSHDEGAETFKLVLSNASGAPIATGDEGFVGDGVATGTITNDGPMPAAWLARFGRGVAERALDGIAGRLDAPRGAQGLRGTVAGVPLGFGVPGGAARPGLGAAPGEFGGVAPMAGGVAAGAGAGARSPSGGRLSWGGAEDAGGGSLGLWGRASRSRFDGREGALALDGETATTLLGADYARGRWLAGVALARSRGEGAYRAAGAAAAGDCAGGDAERGACMAAAGGAVSSSLTAAIPYASLRASERLRLWGAAGAGAGEVSLATAAGGIHAASTSWRMAAAGLRGDLLGGGAGPALAVVSDALWTRAASAAARGLAASDSGASRLRLGLEGRWELPVPGGGRLTPSLEAGARRDGGDAETGLGVELGGGLAWRQPSLGIALDLSGRTLASHADGAAAERGLSASLAYDPTPASARGLSLSLRQDWGGQAGGGLDALFADDPLAQRLEGGVAGAGRWTMEAGWGALAFGGRFVGTPHAGVSASAHGRDYSIGWRLAPEAAGAPDLTFGLRATLRESDRAETERGVGIEATARW